MANIVINEISQNYSYSIGNSSYACIAMPITACWGPYLDLSTKSDDETIDDVLEKTQWQRFSANQTGLESFVSTYRGPSSCYRLAKDFSYQMAVTLLTAGYDILVCRMSLGQSAESSVIINKKKYSIKAKYPGTFGNNIQVVFKTTGSVEKSNYRTNIITYVVDSSGIRTAVENLLCTFDESSASDNILYISELESNFLTITYSEASAEADTADIIKLEGGSDLNALSKADATPEDYIADAVKYVKAGYIEVGYKTKTNADTSAEVELAEKPAYLGVLEGLSNLDSLTAHMISYRSHIYHDTLYALDILKDKLTYNHNRIFLSGWDDQDFLFLTDEYVGKIQELSPFHIKLLDVAYNSRCATGMIDIPRSLKRSGVYNESENATECGYAQKLSRYEPSSNTDLDGLYATHCALFAPWGQYKYSGTSKTNIAPPSFLAMMIQRSMILGQSIQYEWALPTSRKHSLNIGKMDYKVPKKILDEWQTLEGVGVNVITHIPDIGTSLWGNSTLFETPPATYQALANLSTRYLVNAVENLVWKCGVAITFRYNNADSYNSFYAGVSPLLDTMQNVGAIEGYRIEMSADINGLDSVNANSVIGKIYLIVTGVVNNITVDLIALPQGSSLE